MTDVSSAGLGLFAHDFDRPAEGVIVLDEPEVAAPPVPAVTEAMVAQAREEGFREGLAHGRAEAATARDAALAEMTARLVAQMDGAATALAAEVDRAGGELAQLVLAAVGGAFPALCARHGPAEVQRFTREVVTLLAEEPRIVVRVHPDMTADAARVVAALEPERREAVVVEALDSLAPGDAGIAWRHGLARRDARGMWARVVAVLEPLGLAPLDLAPVGMAPLGMAPADPAAGGMERHSVAAA